MTDALVIGAPRRGEIAPLYGRLAGGRRSAHGLSKDEVAADQRRRLNGAMIEAVDRHGYQRTTAREVCRLAAVSERTFYALFLNREACFLATYDTIVQRVLERVCGAYRSGGTSQTKLRAAFDAYATALVSEPEAGRLALTGALGAGPRALARMRSTRRVFEELIVAGFARAPDGKAPSSIVVKGIVYGIERIARQRLAGDLAGLPALTEELSAWALSYRFAVIDRLGDPSLAWREPPASRGAPAESRDERVRILRATAQLTACGGYAQLTSGQIIDAAGVSEEIFNARYQNVEECFLAALGLLAVEALRCAETASQGGGDPLAGVHRGIVALMRHVASDPVLMRVAFGEVCTVGPAAVAYREELLCRFTDLLTRSLPKSSRPPSATVEGIVGGIWGIIQHHVTSGSAQLLPALAGHVSYLALAPAVGGEVAVDAILAADQAV